MAFFYYFLVLAVDVFSVFARMSTKCLVLEEASPYPGFSIHKSSLCPRRKLTAACLNVGIGTFHSSKSHYRSMCVGRSWINTLA